LVDSINKHKPKAVLDVGCGYNQFKERIPNLTGIDPYNNCADYMVDILDYKIEPESYDAIIALGSINFNSQEDIEARVSQCVNLLSSSGRIYFRANPGIDHKNGPWVHIFPWSFEKCYEIAKKFNLKVETFKKDQDRLYWVYQKS
jgi:cyclopropane fatty-acyl-phospholipid synthase-like methyltransferase